MRVTFPINAFSHGVRVHGRVHNRAARDFRIVDIDIDVPEFSSSDVTGTLTLSNGCADRPEDFMWRAVGGELYAPLTWLQDGRSTEISTSSLSQVVDYVRSIESGYVSMPDGVAQLMGAPKGATLGQQPEGRMTTITTPESESIAAATAFISENVVLIDGVLHSRDLVPMARIEVEDRAFTMLGGYAQSGQVAADTPFVTAKLRGEELGRLGWSVDVRYESAGDVLDVLDVSEMHSRRALAEAGNYVSGYAGVMEERGMPELRDAAILMTSHAGGQDLSAERRERLLANFVELAEGLEPQIRRIRGQDGENLRYTLALARTADRLVKMAGKRSVVEAPALGR